MSDTEYYPPGEDVDAHVEDPLDVETWFDYHSEELAAAWHAVKDKIAELGVYVLDRCTMHDFVKFCYEHSSGRIPPV